MTIKAVLFDIYGTLIDIRTDEFSPDTYETLSKYLEYKNIYISPDQMRWFYHEEFARRLGTEPAKPGSMRAFKDLMSTVSGTGDRPYADADVRDVFRTIVTELGWSRGTDIEDLSTDLSHLFRSMTRKAMFVYPTVKTGLDRLKQKYRLGIVSNAQEAFTFPELDLYGLRSYFDVIVLSSEAGIKKPDSRIFRKALDALNVSTDEVIFVGNDRFSDITGSAALGIRSVLVDGVGVPVTGVEPDARAVGANLIDVAAIIEKWATKDSI